MKGCFDWPVLRRYAGENLRRIAMPLGGIGTGTVSLGGRGNLCNWEIMNRPAKGFTPGKMHAAPFFALYFQTPNGRKGARALQGVLDDEFYEGSDGARAPNHGLPCFQSAVFAAAYPLGQVFLSDPEIPLRVTLQAFNPLIPGDVANSSWPAAILRFQLVNPGNESLSAAVCGFLPNFIGNDGSKWAPGFAGNVNEWRQSGALQGIFMYSAGLEPACEQNGTLALSAIVLDEAWQITHRIAWRDRGWGSALLDFWDDFSDDGCLEERPFTGKPNEAMASLSVKLVLPPQGRRMVTFLLTWHFPHRYSWTPQIKKLPEPCVGIDRSVDWVGNHYTTIFSDAWDAAEKIVPCLPDLERRTVEFVDAFCRQDLPLEVKEAALFNISTLRSQTCFRTPDGYLFGFEGCRDNYGCCLGSCTHVWNYEQTVPFLFGELARGMREIEFNAATDERGLMSFRVHLPLARAQEYGKAAADGQMGAIMKVYREWQLSGDDDFLRSLWPKVRKALAFCWVAGGWDADRDGVMEGCQHNTMDVEYFGPNPQMQGWYLGALRAAACMAEYLGERDFAAECRRLFENGSKWMDAHLFNGEYYEHIVQPPADPAQIAPGLIVGMGAKDLAHPEYQLGEGCLVDQLIGQLMAHICGLGYLHEPRKVKRTLRSILKYNRRVGFDGHFNCARSFVLGDETALLMATYPKGRPQIPFPYFTEVMTGFEYAAALGMIYEGLVTEGLSVIHDIRARYDGRKRNPFDEAECGHHYVRAMIAWGAIIALTGFHYSAVEQRLTFGVWEGERFWATGYGWGTCRQNPSVRKRRQVELLVRGGHVALQKLVLRDYGTIALPAPLVLRDGDLRRFEIECDRQKREGDMR